MQKINIYIIISLLSIAAFSIFSFSKNSNEVPGRSYQESYHTDYKIYNPPMPVKADFCNENIPLNIYYINEKLEREILVNTYWHSNTLLLFKRANRWFPIIDSILQINNIPSDFKYLSLIESGLTQAVSPSGARGFWQIMKKTAIEYNLEVNKDIDERYNVEKATQAACDYIKDSYKLYNNWTLVAASYNMGMGGINKQLNLQKVDNYYDLSLNSETSRYVYRIIALKTIFANPSKYGFQLRECDLYPVFKTKYVTIDSSFINWADFAKSNNISYGILKELNPWLKTSTLTNKYHKKYNVKLPIEDMYLYQGVKSKMSNKLGIYGEKK